MFIEDCRLEESAIQSRWTVRDFEMNVNLSAEQISKKKDRENSIRKIHNNDKIDFTNVRNTDMPHNKVIKMPKSCPEISDEIKVHNQRLECREIINKFKENKCDSKGVIRGANNLTKIEEEGKKEIIEGIKNKGWMFYQTGKSGNIVFEIKYNF